MVTTTTRYPIDFDEVHKGWSIPLAEVASILGHDAGSDQFRFALRGFITAIENNKRDRGDPMVICERKGFVVALSDAEAEDHTLRRHRANIRGAFREHRRHAEVDISGFEDATKKRHDHFNHINGKALGAYRETKRLEGRTKSRTTPRLDGAKESDE